MIQEKKGNNENLRAVADSQARHFETVDIREIYLVIRPEDIAYVKFIFESYEGVGMIRTVDRKKATIVLLVIADFVEVARHILTSLKSEVALTEIPRPVDIGDDWLMSELAMEGGPRQP